LVYGFFCYALTLFARLLLMATFLPPETTTATSTGRVPPTICGRLQENTQNTPSPIKPGNSNSSSSLVFLPTNSKTVQFLHTKQPTPSPPKKTNSFVSLRDTKNEIFDNDRRAYVRSTLKQKQKHYTRESESESRSYCVCADTQPLGKRTIFGSKKAQNIKKITFLNTLFLEKSISLSNK